MAKKCDECGANKGDPHKPTCSHAQTRRRQPNPASVPRPNKGAPRSETYRQPCPPHNPSVSKRNKNGTARYKCSKCDQYLGVW